jgi:predicted metalloprotease
VPAGGGIIDFGQGKSPQPYDEFLDAAFIDITQYWAEQFPTVYGAEFAPVAGIYAHYPDRADEIPSCAGPVAYSEVEGNAFFTSCGDIVVYDDAALLPDLVERLGVASVGVVAAHEYGHAIQQRAGIFDLELPTVDTEQQADCFAGAWTAHVARGESEQLAFGDEDIKSGLVAMIEIRDTPGSDVLDPSGHGTAFDRVGAFQEGFINGPERCAGFLENPNPRVDLTFTGVDLETGGNMAFDDIVQLLTPSLDTFWQPVLAENGVEFPSPTLEGFASDGPYPACDGRGDDEMRGHAVYCAETHTIAIDEAFAVDLYNRFGDLSFAYPVAAAYGDAVQTTLGIGLEGEPRVLLNDCLVGAWLVDIVPAEGSGGLEPSNPNQEIVLSAGDLDEVVLTAVLLGDEATNDDVNGTAFEKIDAFRSGVLGGLASCETRAA